MPKYFRSIASFLEEIIDIKNKLVSNIIMIFIPYTLILYLRLPPSPARRSGWHNPQREGQPLKVPQFRQHRAALRLGLECLHAVPILRMVNTSPDCLRLAAA